MITKSLLFKMYMHNSFKSYLLSTFYASGSNEIPPPPHMHTHPSKKLHLNSRLLFLPHIFAEDDESFLGARHGAEYQ